MTLWLPRGLQGPARIPRNCPEVLPQRFCPKYFALEVLPLRFLLWGLSPVPAFPGDLSRSCAPKVWPWRRWRFSPRGLSPYVFFWKFFPWRSCPRGFPLKVLSGRSYPKVFVPEVLPQRFSPGGAGGLAHEVLHQRFLRFFWVPQVLPWRFCPGGFVLEVLPQKFCNWGVAPEILQGK